MKKKLLMGVTLLLIVLIGFSQGRIPKELLKKSATTEFTQMNGNEIINSGISTLPSEAVLLDPTETNFGNSMYDLWSNTMIGNKFYRHEDGTMAGVWMRGIDTPPGFDDRGTGYNYFDGTAWGPIPTQRIEDTRCGWPSYAPWGENGEINVSHNGVEGLEICTRENKGTGDWVQANYLGPVGLENDPTWPRIITSGENNEVIHMFYDSYVEWQGQATALLYSRSMDGGATWDPRDIILDGMGEDDYFEIGADDYVLAAKDNTVMLLVGGAWNDLFIMKSEDNGDTWDKTIVWEHPYPRFDWNTTITDTFFCCDNSASIAIGPDGKAHVVFGISRVLHNAVGTSYNYWPYCDGIGYWNEDMDEFSNDIHALSPPVWEYSNSEMEVDYNLIGWSQDVDGDEVVTFASDIMSYRELGVSTLPTITVDDAGYIFVLFSSTTETYVYMDYNYKHIWARAGYNGEWAEFHDLTASIFHLVDECIYPLLSSNSDNNIHYIYQLDQIPGLALDDDHEYVDNTLVYGTLAKSELIEYNPFETQTIDVEPGFQFVSTRISPENPDMTEVVADIMNDDLQYIRNSTGAMLRKIGPNWVNGIGDWIGTEGYLIKTSAIGEFTVTGTSINAGTPISLFAGFQFVSYLPESPISATDAFATIIGDNLLYVRNSTGAMLRKIGPNWVNGIGDCIPTEGYLIKMAADAELIYPSFAKSSGITTTIPSHLIFEGGNAAEAVYTMYVDGLEIGDEVAAYNGNVILGSMAVVSNNVFDNDLSIFSQLNNSQGYVAGEPISLKIWSNGNIVMADFEMESVYNSYVSNVYPSIDGEYSVVNISKGTTLKGELVIYPNPATNMINISSPNQINNVSIFNNVGQLVYEGNSTKVNTSNFDAGVYIIKVETTKGLETQKVAIK